MKNKASTITLRQFLKSIIWPYKWYVASMLGAGMLWGIQNALGPYILKLITNAIASHEGTDIVGFIKVPAILYVVLIFTSSLNNRLYDLVYLYLIPQLRSDIIHIMFQRIHLHSFSFFQKNFAGSLANKISDMSSNLLGVFIYTEETMSTLISAISSVVAVYFVHPIFAVILTAVNVCFVVVSVYFSSGINKLSMIFSESRSKLFGKIVDSLGNAANVILFARAKYEQQMLDEELNKTVVKDRMVQWYVLKLRTVQDLLLTIFIVLIILALTKLYQKGAITVGDFVFILSISTALCRQVWDVANRYADFSQELGKCSKALQIMSAKLEMVDHPNAKALKAKEGTIQFANVTFSYEKSKVVLHNQNVTIKAQQKVGLVGLSGSGKTTFVKLILRLFDPDSGSILIDGQDIKAVTQESLRRNIALIPQDVILFHRSIFENIKYGKINATREEVIAAAKKAHCHEFINELSNKYRTYVGERGVKLSGGQRQRIAIARAILADAPILILDEATSALDTITEKYIHESLRFLMKKRTTLVIAHRLSTLSEVDRILVFDSTGRIVEDGAHKELLKRKGLYAKMWKMQVEGFLPE